MVEEIKKKRGRPKKNKEAGVLSGPDEKESGAGARPDVWDWEPSGNQRRDDLCVQMIMGTIAKQGTIKYDHAKDIFNTATQLSYDFGWLVEPKAKKKESFEDPLMAALNNPAYGIVEEEKQQEALANTPAAIFRALREGT